VLLLCLLCGFWYYLVEVPLRGCPSWFGTWLVTTANSPVWYWQSPQPGSHQAAQQPNACAPHAQSRKRRQGDWQARQQERAHRKQHWRLQTAVAPSRRFCPGAFSARCILLCLLLFVCCATAVTAMQAAQHFESSTSGSLSGSMHSPPFVQQQTAQQAAVLLGYELGGRCRSFRSCSAGC
jgi:hypothetical protein